MRAMGLTILMTAASTAPALSADLFTSHFTGLSAKPCYARSYDSAHLGKNQRQQVRRIIIDYDRINADRKPNTSPQQFELGFGFQTRKSTEWFANVAICTARGDRIACSLESDGGVFTLRASGKGLRLEGDQNGFRSEGATDGVEVGGALSDDNLFILQPAPRAQCDSASR